MIDLNEMKTTLEKVNEYIDKLQSMTEIQNILKTQAEHLAEAESRLLMIMQSIDDFNRISSSLENKYKDIDTKMNEILEDYRKVHSSFEYVELELKKFTELQQNTKAQLENDVVLLSDTIKATTDVFNKEICSIKAKQEKSAKFVKGLVVISIIEFAVIIAILILSIIK